MKRFLLRTALAFGLWFASAQMLTAQTNQYLHFDGTDDNVSIPNASATIAGSTAFSMTGWFYDDALSYGQGLMGFRATAGGFYLIQLNSGALECRMLNSAGVLASYQSPNGTIVPQTWQHFAFVYNGSSVRLYRNGVSIGSVAASGTITSTVIPFFIGLSPLSGQNFYYHGRIDEVTLWNKALTQAEIDTMRLHELTGSEPNLQLYYKFNQGVPGGNNTSISNLVTTVNSPTYDGTLLNFSLNGATSNFNGTLNSRFQAISFPQIPTKLTTTPPFSLGATASSGLPVSYTLLSGPATLSGDTLTITGAGNISIRASQAGNVNFDSANSVVNSFVAVDPALNMPVVEARNPLNGTDVFMPSLSTVQLAAKTSIAYTSLFSVQSVQFIVNGTPVVSQGYGNGFYTALWTPTSFGAQTLQIVATSNFGAVTTETVNFNVNQTIVDINNVPAFSGIWLNADSSSVTREAVLPSYVGAFDTIIVTLSVTCPGIGCNGNYDRVASIDVQGPDGQWFEIIRYITPYDITGTCTHRIDLADYMSLFQGKIKLRLNCSTFDNGFVYALKFDFNAGTPPHIYSKVTKVWKDVYPFGDMANLQPVPNYNFAYPSTAVASKLKLVSTGHGWGNLNTGNAAEFYNATHNIWVNGVSTFAQHNWTTCNPNPDACSPQGGTWTYNRAGWCPGSIARYFDYDMTPYVAGATVGLQYQFYTGYTDLCHPNNPACVTGVTCANCADGLNPILDVNCNLITFFDFGGIGLATKDIEPLRFALYPNPSRGIFTLAGSKPGKCTVTILDVVGNTVSRFDWNGEQRTVDLSTCAKGVYVVKVDNEAVTEFKRVIIQ
jgi:Concanavalin A-like lectin/glucanases superfamily/Peptide-N-glycosidase F, C terminal/Secretion system C-terminal sorting domain